MTGCTFEIVGEVSQVETIATGAASEDSSSCESASVGGIGGKRKGIAMVRLATARSDRPKCTGLEAHGVGWKGLRSAILGMTKYEG